MTKEDQGCLRMARDSSVKLRMNRVACAPLMMIREAYVWLMNLPISAWI